MLFWDYQGMAVTYWAYIQKGQDNVVFINLCDWNLACCHFAEDAVFPVHLRLFSKRNKLLL
jgi:hypothetical protein